MKISTARLVSVFLFWSLPYMAANGNEVDVYFITGQSNAINFAKEAAVGSTDVGFTLHFARTSDTFNDFPNHSGTANSFSSNNLGSSEAVTELASQLQQGDRDVALFAFARNGAGLHLNTGPDANDWIWFPGADPANGDLYNDSLYANFVTWTQSRLSELTNDNHTPSVKGLFWFQGEKDGRLGDHALYKQNFENLTDRFRGDYGANLPIVTTEIREVTATADNRAVINSELRQIAVEDALIDWVPTADLEFRSATDVHLTGAGHLGLASRWSAAMLTLQANLIAPGDFNGDKQVDGQDFLEWQRDTSIGSLADWQTHYGTSAVQALSTVVPEPSGIELALAFLCVVARRTKPG